MVLSVLIFNNRVKLSIFCGFYFILFFNISFSRTGMEDAQVMAWVYEMPVSDTTALLQCLTAGADQLLLTLYLHYNCVLLISSSILSLNSYLHPSLRFASIDMAILEVTSRHMSINRT